jgi:hypothetical protein
LLVAVAELPDFASSVARWLRLDLRAVAEGYWQYVDAFDGRGISQSSNEENAAESNEEPAAEVGGMSWQEAAEKLNRLRIQGEPWTSQGKFAKLFGCSSGTVNKAVKNTPALQPWAWAAKLQNQSVPRAQSINEMVTDNTAQSTAPNPVDDAAIREYLERENLEPDERAFFNGLTREHQLFFLNDPDKYHDKQGRPKILGRKP